MKDKTPYLLNIGFNRFLPYSSIIAIFQADGINKATDFPSMALEVYPEEERPAKSYLYCQGNILVHSPIEAKTLKKRYDVFQNKMKGFLTLQSFAK